MFALILIGLTTILFGVFLKHKYSYWEKRGLKNPQVIPFFGTTFEENREHPEKTEEIFYKKYGENFGTYAGMTPVFNTSNPEFIKTILSDLKTFPAIASFDFNDKYLTHSILFKNGLDWKTARAAMSHYYTSKKMRNLLGHFEEVCANLLENVEEWRKGTGDVDVKQLGKYYGLDVILKVLFAIDCNSYKERDSSLVKDALSLGAINKFQAYLITLLPKSVSNYFGLNAFDLGPINRLGDYFKNLIKERRKNGIKYNDLSELLQDSVENEKVELTEEEIIGNILLSFFAATETVSNLVSQMLMFLSQDKDIQEKLRTEIVNEFSDEMDYEKITQNEYLDAFVNESLRLGANFLLQNRTAVVDVKLGEYHIEKGTEINLIFHVPHTSSDYYYHPNKFNPDRFMKGSSVENKPNSLFIPFGSGPKQCLGMRLALLESKYLIVKILQNYKLSKPTDSKVTADQFRGIIMRHKVNVKFEKL